MRRARVNTGRALLGLYPQAWRARYREEVSALIEDDPPGLVALAGLVAGATGAHLRPRAAWREALPRERRAAGSLAGLFACWIALSLAGITFQKETEEGPFAAAEHQHALLGIGRGLVLAGALAGALAIAYGGMPMLVQAVREAARTRDRRLVAAVLAPLCTAGLFAVVSAALFALAPADLGGASLGTRLGFVLPWYASGALVALSAAVAPRVALARIRPSERSLRRAVAGASATILAMGSVTAGLLVYGVGLWRLEPALSGQSGGPVWPSTGAVLVLAGVLAAASLLLAVLARARSRAALVR